MDALASKVFDARGICAAVRLPPRIGMSESKLQICTSMVEKLFGLSGAESLGSFRLSLYRQSVKGAKRIYLFHEASPPHFHWGTGRKDGRVFELLLPEASWFLIGLLAATHPMNETKRYYLTMELL